jgi:hypothetical protein
VIFLRSGVSQAILQGSSIMRAKFIHHQQEWLPGDFEPPPNLRKGDFIIVRRFCHNERTKVTAMSTNHGAGLWDEAGHLFWFCDQARDLAWANNSIDLYSLETRLGPCSEGRGVRHAVRRFDASGSVLVTAESEICVPTGGVEYLVMDHNGGTCLATWLDQTQWGYVLVNLHSMAQMAGGFYYSAASIAPPAFSPDNARIVSCNRLRSGWWTDSADDYWNSPSPGGPRQLGTISVHNVAKNAVSYHELVIYLPPGWLPDRPLASEWNMVWGPEFVSEHAFRIWLPDDTPEVLSLPLPARIELKRRLDTQRTWLD